MHWAIPYIGKKWENGGRGPDAFDCWGLVWWIYKTELKIDLPAYPNTDARNRIATTVLISRESKDADTWNPLTRPVEFCAVGLSSHRLLHHVGIYAKVDGGLVLHAMEQSNVVAQSVSSLRASGFQRVEFFQHGAHH